MAVPSFLDFEVLIAVLVGTNLPQKYVGVETPPVEHDLVVCKVQDTLVYIHIYIFIYFLEVGGHGPTNIIDVSVVDIFFCVGSRNVKCYPCLSPPTTTVFFCGFLLRFFLFCISREESS